MDIQTSYAQQKMEIELLQEKLAKQYNLKSIESRIAAIEKKQEKITTDLHQLSGHANQTTNALSILEKEIEKTTQKIQEISQLKSTLNSISKAIGTGGNTHKVTRGDTLEKIARRYNTSIANLKQMNGLTSNTIIVGQELKVPK